MTSTPEISELSTILARGYLRLQARSGSDPKRPYDKPLIKSNLGALPGSLSPCYQQPVE